MAKQTPITHYLVTKYVFYGFLRLPFGKKFKTLSEAEKYCMDLTVPCILEDSNGKFVKAYK